jgi:transposase
MEDFLSGEGVGMRKENNHTMNYIGIDIHKKYCVLSALNEAGERTLEARIATNDRAGFEEYLRAVGGPCKAVIEACWGWGKVHDLLEATGLVEEVVLAHPYKTRIIAEAQIKTDKVDARALAFLLRLGAVPRAHVPRAATRRRKEVLRQRLFWVRERTKLRNRVHALLDRQNSELALPVCSDLFGVKGSRALEALVATLAEPDGTLLRQDLEVMKVLKVKITELEKLIAAENEADETATLLATLPGVGLVLGALLACEMDDIARFNHPRKLVAYAGLAPTTYSSGEKTYHGRLLPQCNGWLRWAFVEAAWVAIGCDGYFGALYRRARESSGHGANTAIIIVARRMAEIAWQMLAKKRKYENRAPKAAAPRRVKTKTNKPEKQANYLNTFPARSHISLAAS